MAEWEESVAAEECVYLGAGVPIWTVEFCVCGTNGASARI